MKNKKITVIGTGALGKALAYKLKENGFNLAGIAGRSIASAKSAGTIIGCDYFTIKQAAKNKSNVYILAVPDKAIADVAKKIVVARCKKGGHPRFRGGRLRPPLQDKTILIHMSGALSSDILKINKSCVSASCHPIGSFKHFENSVKLLNNASWTLEGDEKAKEFMISLITKLGGRYYTIDQKDKPLYHAACTLASSGLLSLIYASCGMFNNVGAGLVPARGRPQGSPLRKKFESLQILWPLISSSLENLQSSGFPNGLTGPWIRKDKKTIKMHEGALKNYDKNTLKLYKNLAAGGKL